jgi:bacillolysin
VHAQVPGRRNGATIPSLTEQGKGLTVRSVSARTGYVTFAASSTGILLAIDANASAEERARAFVDSYGPAFGLAHSSQLQQLRAPSIDDLGVEHVRMQQVHKGIPVRAGEFLVHLKGARVMAANGRILNDLPENVVPAIGPGRAQEASRELIAKHLSERLEGSRYSEPRLEIFNRSLLSDEANFGSRLAWFVEATGPVLRQYIWIDAETGALLLSFSQLAEAKFRRVYNSHDSWFYPGGLIRSEGDPATGDNDADKAYDYAGVTYDYYLANHGRDSFSNAGSVIISNVHYCPLEYYQQSNCPAFGNAFWAGNQVVYANGWSAADDIVGHELTHGVIEHSADLMYYMQSGALNESFSDIFGETIDLLDGVGNDAANVRWRIGEDLPIGAIRDMLTPNDYGDPGRMSDSSYFVCSSSGWTDPDSDAGGVHTNSGIPNHAYALMVDGGTYNSTTIAGIGLTKAAKIQYRALTVYLTSGATFADNFNALNQSCTDLIGTAGITSGDCAQVVRALQAVEMNATWGCSGATPAPPLCSAGIPSFTFHDTFESVTGNWTPANGAGVWNPYTTGLAKGGVRSAYGDNAESVSDHRLAMSASVAIPAGARLYFDHAYEFENGWDGGVLEYSTNNGASWLDAGGLIDSGAGYVGTLPGAYGNPLAGHLAFTGATYGYTGTRLNLASLAGQSVRFRFRIGTDSVIGSLGWVVDNFGIYTCSAVTTGSLHVVDDLAKLGTVNIGSEVSTVIGSTTGALTDVARTSSGAMYGIDGSNLYSIDPATGARTLIGALGAGSGDMNALTANGNSLLAASNATTSLYSVNPTTGAASALTGSLGYGSMGDLAFHGGSLYVAVQNGSFTDLVRVSLTGSTFTATNLGHIIADNTLFGLAKGTDGNLYAVAGARVIRINVANPPASIAVVSNYAANGSSLGNGNGAASHTSAAFTDDPLRSRITRVKAVHILELRTRINALRLAKGLTLFSWATPSLTSASKVRAANVTELRTALMQAYTAAGLPAPVYTDPTLNSSIKVKAVHLSEVRAAVVAME